METKRQARNLKEARKFNPGVTALPMVTGDSRQRARCQTSPSPVAAEHPHSTLVLTDAALHRFYDGDLSHEEAQAVQTALETNKLARVKLAAIRELGSALAMRGPLSHGLRRG